MEKVLKRLVPAVFLGTLLGVTAHSAPSVAVDGSKVIIDVSQPENASLPLICEVKNSDGEIVYINNIDISGQNLVIEDIGSGDIADVSVGGAINASKCEFSDLKAMLKVSVGDYITYGGYEWRCVGIDENGPLMLCDEPVNKCGFGETSLWQDSGVKIWLEEVFTNSFDKELYAVRTVKQRQNVTDGTVYLLKDGNKRVEFNRYPDKLSNKKLYSYYTDDRFFLPDIIQVEMAAKNDADLLCGEYFWTRTAVEDINYDGFVYTISGIGSVDVANCKEELNVRPAFYLNYSRVDPVAGDGTAGNAYTLKKKDNPSITVSERGFTESLTASVRNSSLDGDLIMAFYDRSDALVSVRRIQIRDGKGTLGAEVDKGLSVKVLFWSEAGELIPLASNIEIINRGVWLK